jgi:putative heme-binding domain-containing protein
LYRDELLGDEFRDNAFVCEPVHNLVHRLVLTPDGVTFKARRAPDEQQNEFLSSRDNWFRPVQVRTGPDGALYVVDMYRFVVEHPRWIAPERLAVLDVRAGENRGRIYRIVPDDRQPEPIRDLTKLATPELVSSLDSPNGTERDRIHMELLRRNDERAMAPLLALAKKSVRPAVRVQTLSVLDGLQRLNSDAVTAALADDDLSVRANALRLSEQFLPQISPAVSRLAGDTDAKVRFQFTLTLGEWNDPRAGELIGEAAVASLKDPWMRAAVLSSASKFPVPVLASILQGSPDSPERTMLIRGLVSTAVQSRPVDGIDDLLGMVAPGDSEVLEVWRLKALTSLIDELSRKGISLEALSRSAKPPVKDAIERIEKSFTTAYSVVKSAPAGEAQREAAIEFISRSSHTEESLPWLASWLTPGTPLSLQTAAVAAMARTARSEVPVHLLKSWAQLSPAIRNHIIATLLSRDDWSERLVSAVENGTVATRELSLTDRQRLLKTGDTQLRERSERLFSSASGASPTEAIARYAAVQSLNGDPENGAAIFEKNCASCHALAGKGHAVGPDLAAYRAKPAGDFVLAILNPSAAIEPRFINYQVETRDGRSLSGIVRSETANSLIVWQNGGIEETILRRDIASMRASTVSLMPEGLEQNIGPQEVADLLAWMKRPPAQ